MIGIITPDNATRIEGFRFFLRTSKSLSIPARNIKRITPISDIISIVCPPLINPNTDVTLIQFIRVKHV